MSSTKRGKKRQRQDNYPTPKWCVKRFLEAVELPEGMWCEPCSGEGAIIRAVLEAKLDSNIRWTAIEIRQKAVEALEEWSDANYVNAYNKDALEFLRKVAPFDVIITNPPFSKAMEIITECLKHAKHVVMLLRLNFLASEERAEFMRATQPDVYVLPNRPSFVGGGKTDSIEYAWFHWREGSQGIVRVLASTPKEERITRRRTRRWLRRSRSAKSGRRTGRATTSRRATSSRSSSSSRRR